jgi:NAD(P)-dependent dehydrogenase (short-subunit alcohol dehydrogenase family)
MAAQNHKGKIALIRGANKGIAYELVRQLGKEGVTVLIAARNAELGDTAAGKLKADAADAYFTELDVTKPETTDRIFRAGSGSYLWREGASSEESDAVVPIG